MEIRAESFMKVLVINTGSSSLKYRLFDMADKRPLAGGVIERIGEEDSVIAHTVFQGHKDEPFVLKQKIKDHRTGMHLAVKLLTDAGTGVLDSGDQIDAIGHRVVQGGEPFSSAIRIDDAVKKVIRKNSALAPLHNPSNLIGIDVALALFPDKPNIAVFDTHFHQTMPSRAFMYGLPYDWYETHHVRKYGFHGISHKFVAQKAAGLMGKKISQVRLITLHLGNGCSACAVKGGECVDTSMGMTPLAGLMMGTRSGDFDPAVIGYLLENTDMDTTVLNGLLNTGSGLKGICGKNDLRDVHSAIKKGDKRAALALDMFAYRIKKQIGEFFAVLGEVDAIVFTAGIGENDPVVRSMACNSLPAFGIILDPEKNRTQSLQPFAIHAAQSRVQVWVIQTNEELQIAGEVVQVLKRR